MTTPIRALIADDDALVRTAVKSMLAAGVPNVVIGEVDKGEAAIEALKQHRWDILILDMSMPGMTGLEVLRVSAEAGISVPTLVLSVFPEERAAVQALRAGASGFISKDSSQDEFLKGVHAILSGKKYVSDTLAEKLASDLNSGSSDRPDLSEREYTVMIQISHGKSAKEIAGEMGLSTKTVRTYRARMMRKLGLRSDAEVIRYVLGNGFAQ
ncbi:MAG: response regulator transcription factor [Deltaproteobacteria bacterium]|nr:response regulator transcription factor [Deltaproteobacteria bacterium]